MPPDFAKIPLRQPEGNRAGFRSGNAAGERGADRQFDSADGDASPARKPSSPCQYDGEATFVSIEGTSMTYAKNTSAPVIKVSTISYYCVEAGVWFKAPYAAGALDASRTPYRHEIYDIPPSSPCLLRDLREGVQLHA